MNVRNAKVAQLLIILSSARGRGRAFARLLPALKVFEGVLDGFAEDKLAFTLEESLPNKSGSFLAIEEENSEQDHEDQRGNLRRRCLLTGNLHGYRQRNIEKCRGT